MLPLIGAGLGLLGGLFGNKSKKKQAQEQRRAEIGGLNLKQQMGEDQRLSRVGLASSILSKLNSNRPAYGGRINFDLGLDPAVLAELQKRRQYDFSQAVPDTTAGSGSGLLAGLFGGAGDLVNEYDFMKSRRPSTPTYS